MNKSILLVFITFFVASCGGSGSGEKSKIDNEGASNSVSTANNWDQSQWDSMEWK